MQILIDGYNLLHQSDYGDRDALIAALAQYSQRKGHQITVVFDGTHKGTAYGDQQHHAGIEILYSPLQITADDVIETELRQRSWSQVVVVSSDRKVQGAAKRYGDGYIYSNEFAKKLKAGRSNTIDDDYDPYAREDDDDERAQANRKGGPANRSSKEERRRKKLLDKL